MEYNLAYHLHCSLTLGTGRAVRLTRILQSQTYAGLLEGTPNKRLNDWDIEGALQRAEQLYGSIGKPHLIEPKRREYCRVPGDMDSVRERTDRYPKDWDRDPEWLPFVQCVAVFQSHAVNDESMDVSCLTIVWYQDDFAFPPDTDVLAAIRRIDWDALATNAVY